MSERRAFRFDCGGCGAYVVIHDARDLRVHDARRIAEREYGWLGSCFCRLCKLLVRAGWDPQTATHVSAHRLPRPLRTPADAEPDPDDDSAESNDELAPVDETAGWPVPRIEIDASIVRSTPSPGPLAPGRYGAAPRARDGEDVGLVVVGARRFGQAIGSEALGTLTDGRLR